DRPPCERAELRRNVLRSGGQAGGPWKGASIGIEAGRAGAGSGDEIEEHFLRRDAGEQLGVAPLPLILARERVSQHDGFAVAQRGRKITLRAQGVSTRVVTQSAEREDRGQRSRA